MDLKKLIVDYLAQAKMLQVATVYKSQPWACTVYFAYDDKLNLYWISKPSRRHSREIRESDKVAGVVVLPHTPGDDVRGIQLEGTAKELTNRVDAKNGMKYYAERYKMNSDRVNKILDNNDDHFCYRLQPTVYVLFDELNFPQNPRQEYKV